MFQRSRNNYNSITNNNHSYSNNWEIINISDYTSVHADHAVDEQILSTYWSYLWELVRHCRYLCSWFLAVVRQLCQTVGRTNKGGGKWADLCNCLSLQVSAGPQACPHDPSPRPWPICRWWGHTWSQDAVLPPAQQYDWTYSLSTHSHEQKRT